MRNTTEKITILTIFSRDTILHLRIPFSFFLLPVFLFGVSQAHRIDIVPVSVLFIALHLFIYPGSNVYNSYMDRDTGSIGGLRQPPPVTRKLFYASIIFDAIGLALCAFIGWGYMLVAACYVAFSKAYSWHGIRLKKSAYGGWLCVMFFQGGFTFMLANMAAGHDMSLSWFSLPHIECMLAACLLIGGSYPLTQIYQHEADSSRGDRTLSYRMGIRGTFIFAILFFAAGAGVLFHYFITWYSLWHFIIFSVCLAPVMGYFLHWFKITLMDQRNADFNHAMLMNKISSVCMTLCFGILLIINHLPVR